MMNSDITKLRPHHLLCTQNWKGHGYSPEFTERMEEFQNQIRLNDHIEVNLVTSCDILCEACPKRLELPCDKADDRPGYVCEKETLIKIMDRGVMAGLGIEEGQYFYDEMIDRIHNEMTEEQFLHICENCSWYALGYCQKP